MHLSKERLLKLIPMGKMQKRFFYHDVMVTWEGSRGKRRVQPSQQGPSTTYICTNSNLASFTQSELLNMQVELSSAYI
jgi:hypothetical protein